MIKTERFPVGELEANCFFVTDEEAKEAFLVDTGDYSYELEERIRDFGAGNIKYLLLTHGHFDHIGYVAEMKKKMPWVKIVIGKDDAHFTKENDLLALAYGMPPERFEADILAEDGTELPFGTQTIKVLATPGHTKGGVCYLVGNSLFTGDTLIKGTIGRTDFPTGDIVEMMASLRKLMALEGDYHVYCGHDNNTTLQKERTMNPYMRKAYDHLY